MKALTIQKPPFRMTKPMYRFWVFGNSVREPLTEQKIIRYYKNNVMQFGEKWDYDYQKKEWGVVKYTEQYIRQMALNWFDRWLGKFVRNKLLTKET